LQGHFFDFQFAVSQIPHQGCPALVGIWLEASRRHQGRHCDPLWGLRGRCFRMAWFC